MKNETRTVTRAVVFNKDEWEKVKKLAAENKMYNAVFIRHNALNCKIVECDKSVYDKTDSAFKKHHELFDSFNSTARTVNAAGDIYASDMEEAEKIISVIEDIVNNKLPPFKYTEVKT